MLFLKNIDVRVFFDLFIDLQLKNVTVSKIEVNNQNMVVYSLNDYGKSVGYKQKIDGFFNCSPAYDSCPTLLSKRESKNWSHSYQSRESSSIAPLMPIPNREPL